MASRACRRVWPAGKAFQWSRFVERRVIRLREAGSGSLLSKIRLKILLVVVVRRLKAVEGSSSRWISVEIGVGWSGCCGSSGAGWMSLASLWRRLIERPMIRDEKQKELRS